jgi:predicted SnoaL-like aldol condensation-catalyzing enzyme
MADTTPEQNKSIVLKAFDTLFNKRDYEAARQFWSDTFIQHSAHVTVVRCHHGHSIYVDRDLGPSFRSQT